jgi:ABC-type Fe3+ transport system substrate-binding protein
MATLFESLRNNQSIKNELISCGINLETDEESELPAKLFSAETYLKANNADFSKLSGETLQLFRDKSLASDKKLHLLALLPCGLRNAFKEAFIQAFPEYFEDNNEEILIDANLNYEKAFYRYIDTLTSPDELPDIFITSDFNSLYHDYFKSNFLNERYFEKLSLPMHQMYEKAGYAHPDGVFSMLTSNALVMVADENKFESGKLPRGWKDLLNPSLSKSIVLRGDDDFFCHAVFYPFYKNMGEDSLSQLAKNTLRGMHPSEMVKAVNFGNTENIAVFVMPYSFAIKIRNPRSFRLIWPEDGAIVSPVQMLVKKGSYQKYQKEIDFITGPVMGEVLEQLGFPSSNAQTGKDYPGGTFNWIGWDFMAGNDLGEVKQRIQKVFFETYRLAKL